MQGRALVPLQPPAGYRQPAEQRRESPARPGAARSGAERGGGPGCAASASRAAGGGGGAATSDRRSGGIAGSGLGALGRLGAAVTASEGGSRVLRRGEATLHRALRRGNS